MTEVEEREGEELRGSGRDGWDVERAVTTALVDERPRAVVLTSAPDAWQPLSDQLGRQGQQGVPQCVPQHRAIGENRY